MVASQGFGGPMFEPADSGEFKSIHRKSGAHYNTYSFDSMAALREFFPNGADPMNFVLFSTSGVHGTYATIEEIEASLTKIRRTGLLRGRSAGGLVPAVADRAHRATAHCLPTLRLRAGHP